MIEKIKKLLKYYTKDKAEMCNIMEEARIKATFSHKQGAHHVLNSLKSKPYLRDHKKIDKVYRDFARVYCGGPDET